MHMPHRERKDQEAQPSADSKEQQQCEDSLGERQQVGVARSQVSSPSIATSRANRQLMMLERKSGPYFSSRLQHQDPEEQSWLMWLSGQCGSVD